MKTVVGCVARAATRVAAGAAVVVCCTGPVAAQVARLEPVDEAAARPDFFEFRANLLRIVERKDTAALYSVVAPDVLTSFGGDGGVAEFREAWFPMAVGESELWHTLGRILALGGSFVGDTMFIAPYTFSRFPDELDAFDHVVIVGANVDVLARPDLRATVLTTVSYVIMPVDHSTRDAVRDRWAVVTLKDNRRGYVNGERVRSPLDYRATFVRRGGVWLLASLVAGD